MFGCGRLANRVDDLSGIDKTSLSSRGLSRGWRCDEGLPDRNIVRISSREAIGSTQAVSY
jgi:hypothetical protein